MDIQRDYYTELPVSYPSSFPVFSPSGIVGSAVRFVCVCVNEGLALCRKGYASKWKLMFFFFFFLQ